MTAGTCLVLPAFTAALSVSGALQRSMNMGEKRPGVASKAKEAAPGVYINGQAHFEFAEIKSLEEVTI